MTTLSPFLWFNEGAQDALAHYERVFHDSPGVTVAPSPEEGSDPFMAGTINVGGVNLILFNGGPYADFQFNPSISLYVSCDDQSEVDRYWDGLCDGGAPSKCGWLQDRFGVSWQIVPKLFEELMSSPDPQGRERVFQAMMGMVKFDCAQLQDAYDGTTT